FEESRATERLENLPRGEECVSLSPAKLHLARHLAGADPPQQRPAAPGRNRLELVLAVHFLQVPANASFRDAERLGEIVQLEAARVSRQDLAHAVEPPVLGESSRRS